VVLVGGKVMVENGHLTAFDESAAVAEAAKQRVLLLERAGIEQVDPGS
jgi:hypothetical protein